MTGTVEQASTSRRLPIVVLILIAALAALSYSWASTTIALQPYYQAAVLSMSTSWHDFALGAFDPAGTVTLDKLPGAFWVQALAVRALGYHTWVIAMPQAIEGVLTVLFLHRAVHRVAGWRAGLIAAFVLAVSPATVALNRGNIADTLMVLFLVLAADSVTAAIVRGRTRALVFAGLWVGLAFQAKMIEAWLVLPGFAVAYLMAGPGPASRRVGKFALSVLVAGVVSISWLTAVSFVPAADRPYVDGSHDDSYFAQVFVYNGFGRYTSQSPVQLLENQSVQVVGQSNIAAPGPARLLIDDLGRDGGWLLPLAFVVAIGAVIVRWRRPRDDPMRAGLLLWGGWLLVVAATFASIRLLNAYYLGALTPAIAALIGIGAAVLRESERGRVIRVGLVAATALTMGYAVWLIPAKGTDLPPWLRVTVIVLGAAVVGAGIVAVVARRSFRFAAAGSLVAVLFVPSVASVLLVAHGRGALDTPFEPVGETRMADTAVQESTDVTRQLDRLRTFQGDAPDLAATQTTGLAAPYIDVTGGEVLPIGGVTGTMPEPTVADIESDVRSGLFRLVIAFNTADPRIHWVATHCMRLRESVVDLYYCQPGDANG